MQKKKFDGIPLSDVTLAGVVDWLQTEKLHKVMWINELASQEKLAHDGCMKESKNWKKVPSSLTLMFDLPYVVTKSKYGVIS